MRFSFIIFAFIIQLSASSQTLGGNSVFNFLTLSNTPRVTALGGINISSPAKDIGLAFNNPALLNVSMHTQMNAVFNLFYAGVHGYHLSVGYHQPKLNTNFAWGLTYYDYGDITETDAAGNIYGKMRPVDWVMQVSASRSYLEKWNYGASLKFISSNYGIYRSNGIALDMGLLYHDSARLFSASLLAKNMGFQLKKYNGTEPDDIPFDLQIGITQKLEHAPLAFSLTALKVHRFNIRYNDTIFNNENDYRNSSNKKFSFAKLVDHLVLGVTADIGDRVELLAGYNFLRRKELNAGSSGNGMNGFSLGGSVSLGKLSVTYARAYYQRNTALNQLGLHLLLNRYFGLGKFGEKIGW